MPESSFDFAIFGSSPFAALLAIALATVHRRKVCLVARQPAALQLARSLDVSVAAWTRPHNWALMQRTRGELESLLGKHASTVLTRTEVALIARSPSGVDALGHARHMAAAFGQLTARLAIHPEQDAIEGFSVEGAMRLRHRPFYALLTDWLEELAIPVFSPDQTTTSIKRNGVVLSAEALHVIAEAAILTDARSATEFLLPSTTEKLWQASPYTSVLTEPGNALRLSVAIDVDATAQTLMHPDGRIESIVRGNRDIAARYLTYLLPAHANARYAGIAEFSKLESVDGAPVIGQIGSSRLHVALALEPVAAFLAPAIARHFAGECSPDDAAYFLAHAPQAGRSAVAEFTANSFGQRQ